MAHHDWFIIHNGKETGPFTGQQLKDMAAKQKLAPDSLVRRGDMQAPKKASTIKGLFPTPALTSDTPSSLPVAKEAEPTATPKGVHSKKTLIIASVVGGTCLFLCCGGFGIIAMFGMKMQDAARKQLAEADALWDKGDKSGALGKYRDILDGSRAHFLKEEDRPRVYGRLIDYEYENGHADAGKALIDKADKDGITPAVSHADAKAAVNAKQAERAIAEANKKSAGLSATVKHDRYTQVIMPELPPERVHDKEEGQLERDIGEVPVPDISKVDFLHGPNGEPVEMVKYFEGKTLRQYGYLYRNKAGKNVYHGPWCYLFNGDKNKKESETIYVHGAVKFMQSWDVNGKPLSLEVFKSDDDHTQVVYEYFGNGGYRFHGSFLHVRYIPTKTGQRVERTPSGLHFHYYENGKVRQEELYENGQQTGIAIYDRAGNKVLGRGVLGN